MLPKKNTALDSERDCPLCASRDTWSLGTSETLASDRAGFITSLAEGQSRFEVLLCRGCRLGFRNSRPSEATLSRYYEIEFPDRQRQSAREQRESEARDAERFETLVEEIRFFREEQRGTIIDIGGALGKSLLPWAKIGWKTCLVDPGVKGTKPASSSIAGYSTIDEAARAGVRADILTSYHCLEHLRDPSAALNEMTRLAAPGCLWVIEVPADILYVLPSWGGGRVSIPNLEHLNYFTPESLVYAISHLGLDLVRLRLTVTSYSWGPIIAFRLYAESPRHPSGSSRVLPAASLRWTLWKLRAWRWRASLAFRLYAWRRRGAAEHGH